MLNCCICLSTKNPFSATNGSTSSLNIFSEIGKDLKISEIIAKHLCFKPLPEEMDCEICCNCWQKLLDFHEFYEFVEKIHQNRISSRIHRIDVELNEFTATDNWIQVEERNKVHGGDDTDHCIFFGENNILTSEQNISKNKADKIICSNNTILITDEWNHEEVETSFIDVLGVSDEGNNLENPLLETETYLTPQSSPNKRRRNCPQTPKAKSRNAKIIENSPEKQILEKNDEPEEKLLLIEKDARTESEKEVRTERSLVLISENVRNPNEKLEQNDQNAENRTVEVFQKDLNPLEEEEEGGKGDNVLNTIERNQIIDNSHEISKDLPTKLKPEHKCRLTAKTKRLKRSKNNAANNNNTLNNIKRLSFLVQEQTAKGKTLLLENETLIKKHLKMLCDLCPFTASDFIELTQHFKVHHTGIKSYIKCCTRKLNCASDIIQHAHLHEDPNYFRCPQCERKFSNRSALKDHFLQYHAPEENLSFACDVCPRKFARYNLLQHHKSKHIPKDKRSFFCQTCEPPRAFANEYILQIHINSRHLKATNICHVCAKEIRSKQSFEKHVRSHFGECGPRVKCPREDCDSWLKDDENLKQHLRRFHSKIQELKCPQCGRLCRSKHSLANHLRETHSSRVFTCGECNKAFKSAKSLKEHMAGHSGEPLYSCQFCHRAFNSSANMYSHKKKKHPVEWKLVCQRNKSSSIP